MDIKDLVVLDANGKRYILVPISESEQTKDTSTEISLLEISPLDAVVSNQPTNPPLISNFGTIFKERRVAARVSQEAIAKISGILQPNISAMENGGRNPRDNNRKRLTDALIQLSGQEWEK